MPAQLSLLVPSFAKIEPAQLPLSSQVAAIAARESYSGSLVVQSLAAHAARVGRLGVLVGHNRFDAYALSQLAIEHGLDPRPSRREAFLEEVARQSDMFREPREDLRRLPAPRQLALGLG